VSRVSLGQNHTPGCAPQGAPWNLGQGEGALGLEQGRSSRSASWRRCTGRTGGSSGTPGWAWCRCWGWRGWRGFWR